MSKDLEKFDPSALMDGVRQRIKATFVSLIPEEHWEKLCQKEVDAFFNECEVNNNYNRTYKSEFREVCKEVLTEVSKEKIKLFIEKYESITWANSELQCGDNLAKLIIKLAPEIFAATFGNMFQNAVSQMKRY